MMTQENPMKQTSFTVKKNLGETFLNNNPL